MQHKTFVTANDTWGPSFSSDDTEASEPCSGNHLRGACTAACTSVPPLRSLEAQPGERSSTYSQPKTNHQNHELVASRTSSTGPWLEDLDLLSHAGYSSPPLVEVGYGQTNTNLAAGQS
eukprot:5688694-Amphidinium_carterae.1